MTRHLLRFRLRAGSIHLSFGLSGIPVCFGIGHSNGVSLVLIALINIAVIIQVPRVAI